MEFGILVSIVLVVLVIVVIAKTAIIVPEQNNFVVERLGKFAKILEPGFSILVPFLEKVQYKHSLKEIVMDIEEQQCFTSDNVIVGVDAVIYFQVFDAKDASYGVNNYISALTNLCQTNLRSQIGGMDLDKTLEERAEINVGVIKAVDEAARTWGVKVLRYEVKTITPPADIQAAMESQMRAEREKRAIILESEGKRDASINIAKGDKAQVVLASEADMEKQVNEAKGEASAITAVGVATAEALATVAAALEKEGGDKAMNLRISENYLTQFGKIAKESTTLVIPHQMGDVAGLVATAQTVLGQNVVKNA